MIVTFENVAYETKGVWKSLIDPLTLRKLDSPIHQCGSVNVVMISKPQFDDRTHSIQFDRDTAVYLNMGNTCETVFVRSIENHCRHAYINTKSEQQRDINGDYAFLLEINGLSEPKKRIGGEILLRVRKNYNGQLIHHPESGNFVESPDRFWSIQVKKQSYKIVVYGKPIDHGYKQFINLKPYMENYSYFVISANYQTDEAIKVILEAKRYKKIRFT